MTTIVRRRKLGMSSVKGICNASTTGIKWCRNDLGIPNDETYIRWGCTANLPNKGKVFNTANAIHQVNDKAGFRRTLNDAELCPSTWFDYTAVPQFEVLFGVVIRKNRHAQGRGMWFTQSREELARLCNKIGQGNYYINTFVPKVAEYRVFVVQGRAVCVAQKTPGNPEDLAWNVAKGGRFDNVRWDDWPLKAVRVSIEAFNLSELDFGGVDVMVDGEGNAYILEINSAPSLTSPYRQQCMAKALDYMLTVSPERIPLVDEKGGYRKFIHPAITGKALIKEVA